MATIPYTELVVGETYQISDNGGKTWIQRLFVYQGLKGEGETWFLEFSGEGFDLPLVNKGVIQFRLFGSRSTPS
jgi:hypothetical protein